MAAREKKMGLSKSRGGATVARGLAGAPADAPPKATKWELNVSRPNKPWGAVG